MAVKTTTKELQEQHDLLSVIIKDLRDENIDKNCIKACVRALGYTKRFLAEKLWYSVLEKDENGNYIDSLNLPNTTDAQLPE